MISGNVGSGIILSGGSTSGNLIQNNIIGMNAAGATKLPNGVDGIVVQNGSNGNTIGGTTSTLANWISGNTESGVYLGGSGTSGNEVIGNLIGTDGSGSVAVANGDDGILLEPGATNNTIGGTASGDKNVIAGNDFEGVSLYGVGTSGNVVIGNIIGLNEAGNAGMANGDEGIFIWSGATNNTIGGTLAADRNIISGNYHNDGVGLKYSGTTGNVVEGNYIGTDITGTTAIGNGTGIDVGTEASDNQIGPGNVISGNYSSGVFLRNSGTIDNTVIGNLIGLNAAGTKQLANQDSGIAIYDESQGNTIGGTASGDANVLSGNDYYGLYIYGGKTSGNIVLGNTIGLNEAGTTAVANGSTTNGTTYGGGIKISQGSTANTIGGTTVAEENVISGNLNNGITLTGTGTSGNLIQNNVIGMNAGGTTKLPNAGDGIYVAGGASNNTIGGTTSTLANWISGNTYDGVEINGTGTSANLVIGNLIGTTGDGSAAVANGYHGVLIWQGASNNTIGGSASGDANIISGNAEHGVYIRDSGTSGNVVLGNLIGLDISGTKPVANQYSGVVIDNAASANTIGGTTAGAANVVSGNTFYGVYIGGTKTKDNVVLSNTIGLNKLGTAAVANGTNGVDIADNSTGNTIGGTTVVEENVISGNTGSGIVLGDTSGNLIQNNVIGMNAGGTTKLANGSDGIDVVSGASGNTIGGTTSTLANWISGNTFEGVWIDGAATSGNLVIGNHIGTTGDGSAAVANGANGVEINGAPNNTIGGTNASTRNIIAGNGMRQYQCRYTFAERGVPEYASGRGGREEESCPSNVRRES